MSQRNVLLAALVAVIALIGAVFWFSTRNTASDEQISVLAWVGYDEADYVEALERASGMDVRVQTYVGGEQMYNLLTQSPPGTYDVVIVDAEYGRRLFAEGQLDALTTEQWRYEDALAPFAEGQPAAVNNSVFGVVARWGAVGLVYNTTVFSAEEVSTYNILFSEKARGRVGIFDWYLPNMGVVSLALGNQQPYDLSAEQLSQVSARLAQLRPQVSSIQAGTGPVIDDLRSGRTSIAPGIGEWASAVLAAEGLPFDYAVPREGGIMWVEAFAIPSSARDKERSARLIAAAMQPEMLALLASRQAYFSQVGRRSSYQFIPENVRTALHAQTGEEAQQVAGRLEFRALPGPRTTEQQWVDAWSQFKAE